MKYAVHAEWTKLRTLPGFRWLLLAIVVLTVLAGALTTAPVNVDHCPTPTTCFEDTTKLTLSGIRLGQVAVVVLAVLAISNEYGTGLIQNTLMAVPRRTVVLGSKVLVVVAVVVVPGVLGVLGSLAVGRAILPGNGLAAPSLTDSDTVRAAVGTVLYLVLIALLSLGVAAVVRDTAGAITLMLFLLFLAPVVGKFISDPNWREWMEKVTPMTAGLGIQSTLRLDQLPIGPWAGIGVLAAYAGTALFLGGLRLVVSDA